MRKYFGRIITKVGHFQGGLWQLFHIRVTKIIMDSVIDRSTCTVPKQQQRKCQRYEQTGRRRNRTTYHSNFLNFFVFVVVLICCGTMTLVLASDDAGREKFVPTKIAFCLTGQLARLELLSKLAHIVVPNVKKGNTVHFFILLDNSPIVKQTFWRYDYSETPYANYNVKKMEEMIAKKLTGVDLGTKFRARVRLEPPSQDLFEVIDGFVPVETKVIDWQQTREGKGINSEGKEEAAPRFQVSAHSFIVTHPSLLTHIIILTLTHLQSSPPSDSMCDGMVW